MKKNTGKEYENFVGQLCEALSENDLLTTVELNVKLPTDKGTKRQFDVVIRTNAAGVKLLIVVEAKDWKDPVPLEIVDALASKMRSVKAHKGIIVARNGFQSGAITEASSYDIDLCTANDLRYLSHFKAKTPVVVHFLPLDRLNVTAEYPATFPTDGLIDYSQILVDGRNGLALFRDELFSGKLNPKIRRPLSDNEKSMERNIKVGSPVINSDNYEVSMNVWKPNENAKLRYNDPKSGYQIPIRNFVVKYQ